MNIIADLNNRTLAIYAPFIVREKGDVQILRADGATWTASLNYRLAVYFKATVIAYCTLTRDALGRTLYGTLDNNTTEGVAAFTNNGNPLALPVSVCVCDVNALGVLQNVFGSSQHEMRYNPITTSTTTLSTDSLVYGREAITSGASSGTVAFGVTFALAPTVTATVECPVGGDVLTATVSATTTGFTYTLSAAAPTSGYSINYVAAKL